MPSTPAGSCDGFVEGFSECPAWCLTPGQARRLWNLDAASCDALLQALVATEFLRRTSSGTFILAAPRARAC